MKTHITNTLKKLGRKHVMDVTLGVALIALVATVAFPANNVQADIDPFAVVPDRDTIALEVKAMQNQTVSHGVLPEADLADPRWSMRIPFTAYSSEPWQTDSTPFITASGTHVRDGVVAANFLPIGTRVRIPELFGDKIFVVEDRMNPRYDYKMDIWMDSTTKARQFGLKYATVEVFPSAK